jgi:pilus assembly protein FimV
VNRTILKTWLIAVVLALPGIADAAGLGKLTVKSALGEPLTAEIEIVAVQREELNNLSAKMASRDAFAQAKLEYIPVLANFRFSIETRADATAYIKLTSTQPINEPFVDMLVELTWSAGKLMREYTFLLDPPGTSVAQPAPVEAKPVSPPVAAPAPKAAPMPEGPGATAPAPIQPKVRAPGAKPAGAPGTYGPVMRGDTLSKIALAMRPQGVSLDQMLVALYRANPGAFMGQNMNRLKTGPILRVPESGEIAAVEAKDAVTEVRAQAADWNAYRQKLAGAAVPVAETPKQAAGGKITTKVEEKAAPTAEQPKEVLKLSKGEQTPGKKDVRSLEARVQALQEENIAKEKALKESNERVAELEKNVKEMQKLIELKGATPPQKPAPTAAPAKPEAAKPEAPKPAEPPKPAAVTPPEKAAEKAPEAKPAEAEKPAAPKPPPPKPASPPPPAEPSFLDSLLDNPLFAGVGALVVAALAAAGLIAYRRKTQAGAVPKVAEVPVEPSIAPVAPEAPVEEKPVPAEEVDPISEADVYLAYGRDAQAEEILKEALGRQPARAEIHTKLLEIYSKRQDKAAFERTARALQGLGATGAAWESVQAMGRAMDAQNPLYGGAPAQPVSEAAEVIEPGKVDIDFNLAAEAPSAAAVPSPVAEAAPAVKPSEFSLDFDLGAMSAEAPAPGGETTAVKSPGAEEIPVFDVAAISGIRPAPGAAPIPGGEKTWVRPTRGEENPVFDVTAISGIQSAPVDVSLPAEAAKPVDIALPDIDLDVGGSQEPSPSVIRDAQWQEVATKFDLAKMYKEMGDKDGAREILSEVIRDGDAQQQEEAKALLASL